MTIDTISEDKKYCIPSPSAEIILEDLQKYLKNIVIEQGFENREQREFALDILLKIEGMRR